VNVKEGYPRNKAGEEVETAAEQNRPGTIWSRRHAVVLFVGQKDVVMLLK
jgi:hypothetical protein